MKQAERVRKILLRIPRQGRFWIREVSSVKTVTIHTEKRRHFISMNPRFVGKLSDRQLKSVLIHELQHLKHNHSEKCRWLVTLLTSKEIVRLFRIAADLEVNQEVKCIRGQVKVGKGEFKNYQKGLNAEQYFVCILHARICRSTQTRKT